MMMVMSVMARMTMMEEKKTVEKKMVVSVMTRMTMMEEEKTVGKEDGEEDGQQNARRWQ